MGFQKDVFTVGVPGDYQVRLGWRDAESEMPEAFALAQFWTGATELT